VTTVQAGTVSAPAITTTGDTNTGIFFPAADTIAFAEGGAEAMRIDSSGNLGIGTSSPGYTLDVNGTVNTTTYRKSGVAGKLLVKSQYTTSGTNFSTTGFTNVVLSNNINYEPVSASSEVWVTITAYVFFDQTGTDNDCVGNLYAYSFQSNGTTSISAVGLTDGTTDNSVGFIDMTAGGEVRSCITIQGLCERASDGEVYVRLWGSLGSDVTVGYAATMTMTVCDFLFKEYL
jgi:hypothetical protein